MVTGYNANDFARKAKKIMVDIDNIELKAELIHLLYAVMQIFFKTLLKYMPRKISNSINWRSYCKNIERNI